MNNTDNRICGITTEINRIHTFNGGNIETNVGGSETNPFHYIIDNSTNEKISIFSQKGKQMIINLIKQYQKMRLL
mgnify:CR=1 FL=1|tara:strand:- start:1596 stop:1820 length:225 start_codon:yes stop_codon:yes gene_type:complete